jgi:hypothetical protein
MPIDLKKVPRWAWIVAALVAVGVWYYFHHKASTASAAATYTGASPTDTAALGGTPAGTDAGAVDTGGGAPPPDTSGADLAAALGDLQAQQAQFYSDFLANQSALQPAGVQPTGSGVTPTDFTSAIADTVRQIISALPTPASSPTAPSTPAPSIPRSTTSPSPQAQAAAVNTVADIASLAAAGIPSSTTAGGAAGGGGGSATAGGGGSATSGAPAQYTVPVNTSPETQLQTQHGEGGQPIHYYTLKSQVPLGPGQTLKFTSGRGYYAG